MNIGSEGIRIEYEDVAVELDYNRNQVVVDKLDPESDSYRGPEIIEQDEDAMEFFIEEIVSSLPKTNRGSEGERYKIEVLGDLPGTEESISEVYKGQARINAGIHEEDGFPEMAYRMWNEYSTKAKSSTLKAD